MFLWTGRLQFWQPPPILFTEKAYFFSFKFQNWWILAFLAKKFSNCFCGHEECSFQESALKNLSKGRKFLAQFPKRMKNNIFVLKKFTPIFPHWHLECSFDNSIEIFFTKCRNFLAQCPELKKKESNLVKLNPSKRSNGHLEDNFDNPLLKSFNKRQKLSCSICKIEMKQILSQRQYFSLKCS